MSDGYCNLSPVKPKTVTKRVFRKSEEVIGPVFSPKNLLGNNWSARKLHVLSFSSARKKKLFFFLFLYFLYIFSRLFLFKWQSIIMTKQIFPFKKKFIVGLSHFPEKLLQLSTKSFPQKFCVLIYAGYFFAISFIFH